MREVVYTGLLCAIFSSVSAAAEQHLDQLTGAIEQIAIPEPTERDPVSVITAVIPTTAGPGDTVTVVIKARILDGWRIYRYVPPTAAYMPTKWVLELPDGVEKKGDWQKPTPEYLAGEMDILIHQGDVIFRHTVKIAETAKSGQTAILKAGLKYQTCNNDMCLRPTEKVTELTIAID